MSVTVRTNRATNPSVAAAATNWAHVAGTSGAATGVRNAGTGYSGTGFFRVAWTAATTALSGGFSYTQTGLSATTQYSHQVWVRSSKTQTVRLSAQYQNSSAVNVGSAFNGPSVALVADTWQQVKVEAATSGAAVDRVVLTCEATTGGALWANGDTFDGDLVVIETGATCGDPFDGSSVNAASIMYAWTGTADASTSTATLYTPVLSLVTKSDDPCHRVEVTISDLTPTSNIVTVWRTADGKRQAVRSARKREVVGSDFVVDYEVPLKRVVTYELEVFSGISAQVASAPQNVTVNAAHGYMQDPIDPNSAIPVYGDVGPNGEAALMGQAAKNLEYKADMSLLAVMGSPDPVALLGQRLAASGLDMSVCTDAAQESANIRNLIEDAPLLLVRPLPEWGSGLPGLCYMAAEAPAELPVNEAWGGTYIRWKLTGDLVAAPTMNVLVPLWTYGDVKALWATYQQAQTAHAGKSYLDVLKSPDGA